MRIREQRPDLEMPPEDTFLAFVLPQLAVISWFGLYMGIGLLGRISAAQ